MISPELFDPKSEFEGALTAAAANLRQDHGFKVLGICPRAGQTPSDAELYFRGVATVRQTADETGGHSADVGYRSLSGWVEEQPRDLVTGCTPPKLQIDKACRLLAEKTGLALNPIKKWIIMVAGDVEKEEYAGIAAADDVVFV